MSDRKPGLFSRLLGKSPAETRAIATPAEARFAGFNGLPYFTDWAWRPNLWRVALPEPGQTNVPTQTGFGDSVTLFHDCAVSELTTRQIANPKGESQAEYAFRMDVFRFEGSFLSLAVDLPKAAVAWIDKHHIFRIDTQFDMEKPIEIFLRLNAKHGPNTETLVKEVASDGRDGTIEFDLAYSKLSKREVEKAWVDVIFEGPEMNQVTLRDLTFACYPRAEI